MKYQGKNEFGFIFWLHLAIILFFYLSPFLVDWKVIGILVALYFIQVTIFGNCYLNIIQWNDRRKEGSFHYHYLSKFGCDVDEGRTGFFFGYVIHWLVLGFALLWQVILGHGVLWHFGGF